MNSFSSNLMDALCIADMLCNLLSTLEDPLSFLSCKRAKRIPYTIFAIVYNKLFDRDKEFIE